MGAGVLQQKRIHAHKEFDIEKKITANKIMIQNNVLDDQVLKSILVIKEFCLDI